MCVCVFTHIFKLFLQNKVISKGFLCFDSHFVNHSLHLPLFLSLPLQGHMLYMLGCPCLVFKDRESQSVKIRTYSSNELSGFCNFVMSQRHASCLTRPRRATWFGCFNFINSKWSAVRKRRRGERKNTTTVQCPVIDYKQCFTLIQLLPTRLILIASLFHLVFPSLPGPPGFLLPDRTTLCYWGSETGRPGNWVGKHGLDPKLK